MTTGSTGTKKTLFKIDLEKQSAANKKYKDTVFRKLFHQKKELLELYNALNDSDYSEEEELQIVTLDNCLYLSMRNDLAFICAEGTSQADVFTRQFGAARELERHVKRDARGFRFSSAFV